MAPKKKQQNQKPKSSSKPGGGGGAAKLQISAENENRLRRLLLSSQSHNKPNIDSSSSSLLVLTREQRAKKLKTLYEKLSCEGFTNHQIELALSALKDASTFETALDWLCLNLPGNELPFKFSSGSSLQAAQGGSVGIVSTAREDWSPSWVNNLSHREEEESKLSVKTKGRWDDDDGGALDSCQSSQADWIRQYVQQQQEEEEEEEETWEDREVYGLSNKKANKPRSFDVIAEEYHIARMEAAKAKGKRDKKSQEQAGHKIRQLKQELSALGLSDASLTSQFCHHKKYEDSADSSLSQEHHVATDICDATSTSTSADDKAYIDLYASEFHSTRELAVVPILPDDPLQGTGVLAGEPIRPEDPLQGSVASDEEAAEVELGDMFSEDASSNEVLSTQILELQKKEKLKELLKEENLDLLDGIWKKGDLKKIPKAVLHQLCQRSGWEAPKFNKVPSIQHNFSYLVNILRKASGRGKSKKAGGLVSLQLPHQDENFESAEDGQNRVAAFALCQLFPELPVHLAITEPYASMVIQWKQGDSTKIEESEEDRRTDFVNSLLGNNSSRSATTADIVEGSLLERSQGSFVEEDQEFLVADPVARRGNYLKEAESLRLRQKQESKKKMNAYKDMLNVRAALPIAQLKDDILHLLKDNDVLVVCGETGSGKTTQVPQFILDDMIESGHGGYCNIICTQPRRIAAISVAERVSDERCEPSPGSEGSLVGYQVRLDSARNESTKLLFCTTGILLRKLAGDKSLNGITHVVVDEVHERSLLGDFLLIVLKKLIEKQSAQGAPRLKVILMSATVDSNLFSKYFGECPVITAEGRTHPVATHFLEDIYERINYRLASDSPAFIRHETSSRKKFQSSPVSNHRGKKNLVLSGWGDESVLSDDCINPHYDPINYQSYSEQTQWNLKKLNEDVIDYDLIEDLICHIDDTCEDGAILVFLPGVSEINMLLDKLAASYRFGGQSSDWLLALHSSVSSSDQKRVFLNPPKSMRKVIISTNIAETSITINDVVYVVDCGRHKESRYNPQKKLSSMVEDWISRANARQRRGRAGRVKPGICFSLYTRYRFEKLMRPYQVPEMLRMPLVELCLQIKLLSLGYIRELLSKALEPPKEDAITTAVSLLYEVGAIEGDEVLTPLGHHLAKLPVDVLIGKMMLYGAIFGCLSPILTISAFLSYKSPFLNPKDERQNVERAKLALLTDKLDGTSALSDSDRQSDHILMVVAYNRWDTIMCEKGTKAAQQYCKSYYLSSSVMYMIRDMRIQFGTLLADIGLINLPKKNQVDRRKKDHLDGWFSDSSQPFNKCSYHHSVVKAILCAGLYPNVAASEQGLVGSALSSIRQPGNPASSGRPFWYDGRREVHIHPSSVNSNVKTFQYPFLVFLEKVETNKVFLRDTTIMSPYSILLFGGSIDIQHQAGIVSIDGWLKLTAPAQTAVLFKELRLTLQSILNELIKKPEKVLVDDDEVVKSIIYLLKEEEKSLR